jgi:hypothetical protein
MRERAGWRRKEGTAGLAGEKGAGEGGLAWESTGRGTTHGSEARVNVDWRTEVGKNFSVVMVDRSERNRIRQ